MFARGGLNGALSSTRGICMPEGLLTLKFDTAGE